MDPKDMESIDFNTGLLVKEMEKRGIKVSFFGDTNIIKATNGDHTEYLDHTNINIMGYMTKFLLDNKYTTKLLLQEAGFSTVNGKKFNENQLTEALIYTDKIGFPLVIKPTMGAHGTQVHLNIGNVSEFIAAFHSVRSYVKGDFFNEILVEKYFVGNEYRVFVTKNGFFAAIHREPANIEGDGKLSIGELIDQENHKRMNPRKYALCTIKVNPITITYLESQGLTLTSVPKKGEKVYVRPNSNVCTGGNCRDITDQVHPSVKKITTDILFAMPDLPFMGIDFMTEDITKKQDKKSYIICEINANPGFSLHTHEETENYRDTPGAVIDLLFPETKIE